MDLKKCIGQYIHVLYKRGVPPQFFEKEGELIIVCGRQICLRYTNEKGKTVESWTAKPLHHVDIVTIIK